MYCFSVLIFILFFPDFLLFFQMSMKMEEWKWYRRRGVWNVELLGAVIYIGSSWWSWHAKYCRSKTKMNEAVCHRESRMWGAVLECGWVKDVVTKIKDNIISGRRKDANDNSCCFYIEQEQIHIQRDVRLSWGLRYGAFHEMENGNVNL